MPVCFTPRYQSVLPNALSVGTQNEILANFVYAMRPFSDSGKVRESHAGSALPLLSAKNK